jgi:hypothetical protein
MRHRDIDVELPCTPHRASSPFCGSNGQVSRPPAPDFDDRNLAAPWACLPDVRDGQLPAALGMVPDLALVAAGGNDVLLPTYTRDRVWRDLLDVLVPLADLGALVVTVGLFDLAPSGVRSAGLAARMTDRLDELHTITAVAVAQVGGVHIDTHHRPRAADPGIFAGDLVHANAAGHAVASAAIVRALASVFRGRVDLPG